MSNRGNKQQYYCLICGHLIETSYLFRELGRHIKKHHDISLVLYMENFVSGRPLCKTEGCSNEVQPNPPDKRYRGFWQEHCSKSCRTSYHNAGRKDAQSKVLTNLWENSKEFRENQAQAASRTMTEKWSNPDTLRQHSLETIKRLKNPEDDFCMYVDEVDGIPLRSRDGEGTLARVLSGLGIRWTYEEHIIPLSDGIHHFLPDFYLPDYNIFIEFRPSELLDDTLLYKIDDVVKQGFVFCLFDRSDIESLNGQSAAKLEELLSSRRFNDYPERE